MTDKDDELSALKARIDQLERAAKPAEPVDWQKRIAEHQDEVHQMREGRMSMAMPPSVVREMTVLDDRMVKEITLRDARAPNNPAMIPQSQQPSRRDPVKSSTPGYSDPRKLGPQPGIDLIDRAVNAALPHGREWGKK
jgi:hypothetical protein